MRQIRLALRVPLPTVLLFVAVLITACATPYKPDGFAGGYSESWYSHNVVYVHFQGNGYTSRARTQDLARLRAAELAIENGFEYIALVDSDTGGFTVNFRTPSYATMSGSINSYGGYSSFSGRTTYSGGQTIPIRFPSSGVVAVLMRSKDEYPDVKAIPAELLFEAMKARYGITKPTLKEVQARSGKGPGEFLEGRVFDNDSMIASFRIETGYRSGAVRIPLYGTTYEGEWLLVTRGDSVAEIAGELRSSDGGRGFVRFDVIPGDPPRGVGSFTLESGEAYRVEF